MSTTRATESAPDKVTIVANGRELRVDAGISVAAALLNSGMSTFRRSVHGGDRGPLCGMGVCYECRVTIGGVLHRRACLVTVADGLHVSTGADA